MNHLRDYLTANVESFQIIFDHHVKAHHIEAGLTLKIEHIEENSREWEMRDSSGYSLPYSSDALELTYNLNSNTKLNSNRFESYLQDTYKFKGNAGLFTLNYGARFSHWTYNKESLFSPRISITFTPTFNEKFTFRFATGLYYQAPFYKELRDTVTINGVSKVVLNKNIKSQRSIHFILAGDYNFQLLDRPFRFTTELYYKALSNIIPYTVDNVRIVYYGNNLCSGYSTGLDFKLYGEFVPGTDSWISLSLMRSKQKYKGVWIPLPTEQRYAINLFYTDYFPGTDRWKMNLKACMADGLPFGVPHAEVDAQNFRAPAYRRVDIGMSYKIFNNENHDYYASQFWNCFKNIWLGVDVFNLFDISNVSSYYWITDVNNNRYAVPNYLTRRQINCRILIEF
jgi:hypothetical protein